MCVSLFVFEEKKLLFFFIRFTKPTSNRRNVSTTTEARADHTIRFMNELKNVP